MRLRVDPLGTVQAIYDEAIDLTQLGPIVIRRASHVEPDESGQWWVDLHPVGGPRFGPFQSRSLAIAVELVWLENALAQCTL